MSVRADAHLVALIVVGACRRNLAEAMGGHASQLLRTVRRADRCRRSQFRDRALTCLIRCRVTCGDDGNVHARGRRGVVASKPEAEAEADAEAEAEARCVGHEAGDTLGGWRGEGEAGREGGTRPEGRGGGGVSKVSNWRESRVTRRGGNGRSQRDRRRPSSVVAAGS